MKTETQNTRNSLGSLNYRKTISILLSTTWNPGRAIDVPKNFRTFRQVVLTHLSGLYRSRWFFAPGLHAPVDSCGSISDSQRNTGRSRILADSPSQGRDANRFVVTQRISKSLSVSRWSLGSSGRISELSFRGFRNPILKLPKAVRDLKPQNQVRHSFRGMRRLSR